MLVYRNTAGRCMSLWTRASDKWLKCKCICFKDLIDCSEGRSCKCSFPLRGTQRTKKSSLNNICLNIVLEKRNYWAIRFRTLNMSEVGWFRHMKMVFIKLGKIILYLFLFPQTLLQTLSTSWPKSSFFNLPIHNWKLSHRLIQNIPSGFPFSSFGVLSEISALVYHKHQMVKAFPSDVKLNLPDFNWSGLPTAALVWQLLLDCFTALNTFSNALKNLIKTSKDQHLWPSLLNCSLDVLIYLPFYSILSLCAGPGMNYHPVQDVQHLPKTAGIGPRTLDGWTRWCIWNIKIVHNSLVKIANTLAWHF